MLPSLSLLPNDPEESVRAQYAATIAGLAARAQHFLMQAQASAPAAADAPGGATVREATREP